MNSSRDQLARQLAEAVAAALVEDLQHQSRVLLVVSGGSTPAAFLRALSTLPLDWTHVDVTLADERWVEESDPASNARLVRETLLQNCAAGARFVGLKTSAGTPEEGVAEASARMCGVPWPASAVVLGMGADGHTASLFADSPELELALATAEPLVAVRSPGRSELRMTLSADYLHRARRHFLHITGEHKRAVLAHAMLGDDVRDKPVRTFLACPLSIYWAP
ncbi:6-phosphogluconolactonase [Vreelandella jeotgali]|uniref:6-phosphogluconolactonase n=1 Tax=Vreelandella jeotgali TaxID=553386 RepID=UPI000349ECB6|nr:6-phosphogluconolactonase [Halomonas jeotgali]